MPSIILSIIIFYRMAKASSIMPAYVIGYIIKFCAKHIFPEDIDILELRTSETFSESTVTVLSNYVMNRMQ